VLIQVVVENKKKGRIGWGIDGHVSPIEGKVEHQVLLFA
jgi:hypothetical protein